MDNNTVPISHHKETHDQALVEINQQSASMQTLMLGLWKDLKPMSYRQLTNEILSELSHMGDLLDGFTDDVDGKPSNPWRNNAYYSYPQGGKTVHDASTYMMEMFTRKLHLVISLTVEFVDLEGRRMIQITGQGINPVSKILIPPTVKFYSGQIPAWCLKTHSNSNKAYSPEQISTNHARGLQIIVENASSKARRDIAKLLVGRDIPKVIGQICYASELEEVTANIAKSRESCIESFSGLGITESQLHAYLGMPPNLWRPTHIANLRGLYARCKEAIDRGDTSEVAIIFGGLEAKAKDATTGPDVDDMINPEPDTTPNPKLKKCVKCGKEGQRGFVDIGDLTHCTKCATIVATTPEATPETVDAELVDEPDIDTPEATKGPKLGTGNCSICKKAGRKCAPFGKEWICAECQTKENLMCPDCERYLHKIHEAGATLEQIKDKGMVTGLKCSVCKG